MPSASTGTLMISGPWRRMLLSEPENVGRLADDRIAGIHEGAERQRQRGAGPVGHEDVVRRHVEVLEELVLVADQLAHAR